MKCKTCGCTFGALYSDREIGLCDTCRARSATVREIAEAYLKLPDETLDETLSQLEDARNAKDAKAAESALWALLGERKVKP